MDSTKSHDANHGKDGDEDQSQSTAQVRSPVVGSTQHTGRIRGFTNNPGPTATSPFHRLGNPTAAMSTGHTRGTPAMASAGRGTSLTSPRVGGYSTLRPTPGQGTLRLGKPQQSGLSPTYTPGLRGQTPVSPSLYNHQSQDDTEEVPQLSLPGLDKTTKETDIPPPVPAEPIEEEIVAVPSKSTPVIVEVPEYESNRDSIPDPPARSSRTSATCLPESKAELIPNRKSSTDYSGTGDVSASDVLQKRKSSSHSTTETARVSTTNVPTIAPPKIARTLDSEAKRVPLTWGEETPNFWSSFNTTQTFTQSNIQALEHVLTNISNIVKPVGPLSAPHVTEYAELLKNVTEDPFCPTAMKVLYGFSNISTELTEQFEIANTRERETIQLAREAKAKYEEHERLSTTFHDKIKRYLQLKTTTDPKKLQEKSFKLANLQHQLEMSRFATYSIYHQLNETMAFNVLSPLVLRISALWNFFKSGYELIAPFEDDIDEICSLVFKQTSRADEIKAECRRQAEFVEKQASEQQRLMSASSTHVESSLSLFTNTFGLTSTNAQAGVRDLDPRRVNRELGYVKRGYLHTPFPTHVRVWVELDRESLTVYTPPRDKEKESTVKIPIVLCTVKHNKDQKLRHVFTVISPQTQIHLQTDHEAGYNQWFDVIQNAISEAINRQQEGENVDVPPASASTTTSQTLAPVSLSNPASTHSITTQPKTTTDDAIPLSIPDPIPKQSNETLLLLQAIPGNKMCADCSAADPEWLSLNLGVLVCLECSGVHRSLGVQTSKVRSATMDSIDSNHLDYLKAIGNRLANSVWEEELYNPANSAYTKCMPSSPRAQREQYIRLKYESKRFMNIEKSLPPINVSSTNVEKDIRLQAQAFNSLTATTFQRKKNALTQQTFEAIQENNIASLYRAMCWGADPLWSTPENEGRNAVHQAVMYANIPAAVCVMYNCPDRGLFTKEDRGWNVLHYAAYQNSPAMIELCLSFGGSKLTAEADNEGKTAEDIVNTLNIGESFEKDKPEVLRLLQTASQKYQARLAREKDSL